MRTVNLSFCLLLGLLVGLGIIPARAETLTLGQPLDSVPKIKKYLLSDVGTKRLYEAGVRVDLYLGRLCEEQHRILRTQLIVRVPVMLPPEAEHPNQGVWTERFEMTRCGETVTYNAMTSAQRAGPPRTVPLLPGMTAADPILMRDVLEMLRVAVATEVAAECLKPRVANTQIVNEERDVSMPDGTISPLVRIERWTGDACGSPFASEIQFISDPRGGGTTFSVKIVNPSAQ